MILWHLFFPVERDRYIRNLNRFQMSFQEANLDFYSYNIGNEDEECMRVGIMQNRELFSDFIPTEHYILTYYLY